MVAVGQLHRRPAVRRPACEACDRFLNAGRRRGTGVHFRVDGGRRPSDIAGFLQMAYDRTGVTNETTSLTLLDRVRRLDDRVAWREFDERYRELILRYCDRRGLQPADAEDIRQEVMLALAGHLPDFEYRPEVGRFRDYLRTSVRNAISKRFGRNDPVRGALSLEDGDSSSVAAAADDSDWESEWTLHHLRLAMGLVRRDFHAKSLAVFEDLLAGSSPDDVAARHATSVANVYKIKQRVRERLTAEVARLVDEGEFAERRNGKR